MFTLPVQALEEYYPSKLRESLEGTQDKVRLAKKMGERIEQRDFEENMSVVFQALTTCASKAFGSPNQ